MEIERKYLIKQLPEDYQEYPKQRIEQAYLCVSPVVRVRRSNDVYYLTYKGAGLLVREEANLPLTAESYQHLLQKADGNVIAKDRFCIPYGSYTIELDVFDHPFAPLAVAEVEFGSEDEAMRFQPPEWFGEEVTFDPAYTNSALSQKNLEEV
jgi:CYTH domain-containing protein